MALSPVILGISRKYENYGSNILATDTSYIEFLGNYAKYGFGCVFNFKSEEVYRQDGVDVCRFTIFPLIFYVLSIFVLQASITTVSKQLNNFISLAHATQENGERKDGFLDDGTHNNSGLLTWGCNDATNIRDEFNIDVNL